jgi:hypothetical protein
METIKHETYGIANHGVDWGMVQGYTLASHSQNENIGVQYEQSSFWSRLPSLQIKREQW